MATLLAHIRVRPGAEKRFEQIARELHDATHACELDVRRYEYWRGAEPGTYYTLESFDDFAGFLAHEASPHHLGALPALREVLQDVRLEWVDPIADASPLTPTELAPAPDTTGLEEAYSERYGAKVQDWWLPLRTATGGGQVGCPRSEPGRR
jgi:quinol monooxygenase YgiN